jgi:phosphatidylglycerol lysyltransferase
MDEAGSHHYTDRARLLIRTVRGISAAAPALLLALLAASSLAYFVRWLQPLAVAVDRVVPIDPGDANASFALMSALGMGALCLGLTRGKAMAWWLAVATLTVALLAQTGAGPQPVGLVLVAGALAVLLADNRRYRVATGSSWMRRIFALLLVALVLVGLETSLIIVTTGSWPRPFAALSDATASLGNALGISDDVAGSVLSLASHNLFLGLLLVVARLPIVLAAIGILSWVPEPPVDPTTRARARAIAERYGSGALLPFQLGPDKLVYSPEEADGVVVYGMAGRTAVVLGDPIGPVEHSGGVLSAFFERCRRIDHLPVVYQASSGGRAALLAAGFRVFRVGEEAVIDLPGFDLTGSRRANLRHTITRCHKAGVSTRWFPSGIDPKVSPQLVADLESIDEEWRRGMGPQLGFTVSHFDAESLSSEPVAVALDENGRALGFTTFRPTGIDGGWVLDLMRRTVDSPPGVVEMCIAAAAAAFRAGGSTSLSLGLAPLANVGAGRMAEDRLLALGARFAGRWYDVSGLAFFKGKFDPVWIPRYGAIRRRRDFVGFVIALLWVHVRPTSWLSGWHRSVRRARALHPAR